MTPLSNFFNKLNYHNIGDSLLDTVKWDLNSTGDFMIKSSYLKLLVLNCPLQLAFDREFPYRLVWRASASVKDFFFGFFLVGRQQMGRD